MPLYSLLLVGSCAWSAGAPLATEGPSPRRLLVLTHLIVPAALSLLMLLLFFPLVLGLAEGGYRGVSGLSTDPYLPRWLILSGALFVLSGAILAVRLARAPRPERSSEPPTDSG